MRIYTDVLVEKGDAPNVSASSTAITARFGDVSIIISDARFDTDVDVAAWCKALATTLAETADRFLENVARVEALSADQSKPPVVVL